MDDLREDEFHDQAITIVRREDKEIRKSADNISKWCVVGCAIITVFGELWDWLFHEHAPSPHDLWVGAGSLSVIWCVSYFGSRITEGLYVGRQRMIRIELLLREQARFRKDR